MADNETTEDVIAEMRGIRVREFQEYADRLEAAHRREIEAVGDAKKLGAALLEIRDAMRVYMSVGGISARRTIEMAFEIARDALAAPPRNCDRFKTAAEAIDAYQDLTGDQLATDSGMKEWVEFAVWLFATATEKEEGAE